MANLPKSAYLTGQRWDMLAWERGRRGVVCDFGGLEVENRNILHWMLTDPTAKPLFGGT